MSVAYSRSLKPCVFEARFKYILDFFSPASSVQNNTATNELRFVFNLTCFFFVAVAYGRICWLGKISLRPADVCCCAIIF